MFERWDSFFLMIGGAAGALIGLLFIVETLTAGFNRENTERGARLYMSPTVFHFAVALVVSALALAPTLSQDVIGGVVAAISAIGLIYAVVVSVQLGRLSRAPEPPHWTDFWYYGALAAVLYLLLEAAAISVWAAPALAPCCIGFVLLGLVLLGVRNAWDLVTWIAPRVGRGQG